jgi:hypothetical protein
VPADDVDLKSLKPREKVCSSPTSKTQIWVAQTGEEIAWAKEGYGLPRKGIFILAYLFHEQIMIIVMWFI